ncbi:MAG TPA: choice-of-anchor U domain-containing protein [Solirubrobacteraceae bacterium]|nr:choice-of-anchor U domain-containing protein [Solirubrobacteraceae bacterium]
MTLVFLILLVTSAGACLTIPATSNWYGHTVERGFGGYKGLWQANVTSTEVSPGVWTSVGDGQITLPTGSGPGHVESTLICTSPTTYQVTDIHWTDVLGDNTIAEGTLSVGKDVALESGTWRGTVLGFFGLTYDYGEWEGEFHPETKSTGPVPGNVEVESSSGTLINSLETGVITNLPLLPPEAVAPVGQVSFAANLSVGETVKVKLILPPGSHPTSLLKLVGQSYVQVPATIVGETVEFEITDGGIFDEDHVANGEVIDPVIPVSSSGLQVQTGGLPEATRGTAYHVQLTASGGTAPYKWKKVVKLPKGMKLTKTGAIEGTPSTKKLAAGKYPIEVTVSGTGKPKQSASAIFTLGVK